MSERKPLDAVEFEELTRKIIEKAHEVPSLEEMLEALAPKATGWKWSKRSGLVYITIPLLEGFSHTEEFAPTLREAVEKAYHDR